MKFSVLSQLFSPTDEEAMCQVKLHDDHRAFAQLVERWDEPIRRLCTRMTGDPYRGEDLKQDTFARLFERRKRYEPTGRFSTFLWRIALNICRDELRRVRRRREFQPDSEESENSLEILPADEPTPDAQAATNEEGELVRRAVLRLPEIYRTVVVLRYYEHFKLVKIAEILEIPEGTVNWRLSEALAKLARIFEPELGESRSPQPNQSKTNKEVLVL
ncbi:MAG: sigma-70 family RNA polymerase sigma factor [Verrucomicrobiales bacterium]|nr:sigma-70 family RNA polymerase sigma factor [Verrucomicrobiales bacterium]